MKGRMSFISEKQNNKIIRLKLNIALLRLTSNYNFDQVVFWGRIDGTLSNYYVAIGLNF